MFQNIKMFIGSVLFLAIWTSLSLAEESSSNDATSVKRAPMGFQGMRGKKDLTSSEREELSKRTQMNFQVKREVNFYYNKLQEK